MQGYSLSLWMIMAIRHILLCFKKKKYTRGESRTPFFPPFYSISICKCPYCNLCHVCQIRYCTYFFSWKPKTAHVHVLPLSTVTSLAYWYREWTPTLNGLRFPSLKNRRGMFKNIPRVWIWSDHILVHLFEEV